MNGILAYPQLLHLMRTGALHDALEENINPTSVDIRLGDKILVERLSKHIQGRMVRIGERQGPEMIPVKLTESGYILFPGDFILASTMEEFNLDNMTSAEYKLKSSMARCGLNHLNAGWIHAGFKGVLTLELKNELLHHSILIKPGDKIGQIVFYRHDPVPVDCMAAERSRASGYLNREEVTPAQPEGATA